jgi:hypothetical protein
MLAGAVANRAATPHLACARLALLSERKLGAR